MRLFDVKTKTKQLGLHDEICHPVYPLWVKVQTADAFISFAINAAWRQTVLVISLLDLSFGNVNLFLTGWLSSTPAIIVPTFFTTSQGYFPT